MSTTGFAVLVSADAAWADEHAALLASLGLRTTRCAPTDAADAVVNANAVLVDAEAPEAQGVIARLRASTPAPILAFCAGRDDAGRVRALDAGADYALPRWASDREAHAALRSVLGRRDQPQAIGRIVLDRAHRSVSVDGSPVRTTATEYALLVLLARTPGEVVSLEALAQALTTAGSGESSVRVHMSNLRKKLGTAAAQIDTVRGEGYVLREEQNRLRAVPAIVQEVMAAAGVTLTQPSVPAQALSTLLRFRRQLMSHTLAQALPRLTDADVAQLRDLLELLDASTGDAVEFFNVELRCFFIVLRAHDQPIIRHALRELASLPLRCGWFLHSTGVTAPLVVQTYRELLALAGSAPELLEGRADELLCRLDRQVVAMVGA